jgi:HEAT repeat protein
MESPSAAVLMAKYGTPKAFRKTVPLDKRRAAALIIARERGAFFKRLEEQAAMSGRDEAAHHAKDMQERMEKAAAACELGLVELVGTGKYRRRSRIGYELGRLGTKRAIGPLIALIDDVSLRSERKRAAAFALMQLAHALMEKNALAEDEISCIRKKVESAGVVFATTRDFRNITGRNPKPIGQGKRPRELGNRLVKARIKELMRQIEHGPDDDTRQIASKELMQLKHPAAIGAMVKLLLSRFYNIHNEAHIAIIETIDVLGGKSREKLVRNLWKMEGTEDEVIRNRIRSVLEEIDTVNYVNVFLERAERDDQEERASAADALASAYKLLVKRGELDPATAAKIKEIVEREFRAAFGREITLNEDGSII